MKKLITYKDIESKIMLYNDTAEILCKWITEASHILQNYTKESSYAEEFHDRKLNLSLIFDILKRKLVKPSRSEKPLHMEHSRKATFVSSLPLLNSSMTMRLKLEFSRNELLEQTPETLCAVCQAIDHSTTEEFAIIDNCRHIFCVQCLETWLTYK